MHSDYGEGYSSDVNALSVSLTHSLFFFSKSSWRKQNTLNNIALRSELNFVSNIKLSHKGKYINGNGNLATQLRAMTGSFKITNIGFQGEFYLKIKLSGKDHNRFAIGARVIVFAKGELIIREQYPVRGFQSSVDPILHFGLDSVTYVDSVHVYWPKGNLQIIKGTSVNQVLTIKEADTTNPITPVKPISNPLFEEIKMTQINHIENEFVGTAPDAKFYLFISEIAIASSLADSISARASFSFDSSAIIRPP